MTEYPTWVIMLKIHAKLQANIHNIFSDTNPNILFVSLSVCNSVIYGIWYARSQSTMEHAILLYVSANPDLNICNTFNVTPITIV